MKHEIKRKRRAILAEIDRLERLQEQGEDVSAALARCGQQLDTLAQNSIPRVDRMDADRMLKARLTNALIERAAQNGINYRALRERIYNHGWEPNKAATFPLKKKVPLEDSGLTPAYYQLLKDDGLIDRDIMEKFGISKHNLRKFKQEHDLLSWQWEKEEAQ